MPGGFLHQELVKSKDSFKVFFFLCKIYFPTAWKINKTYIWKRRGKHEKWRWGLQIYGILLYTALVDVVELRMSKVDREGFRPKRRTWMEELTEIISCRNHITESVSRMEMGATLCCQPWAKMKSQWRTGEKAEGGGGEKEQWVET